MSAKVKQNAIKILYVVMVVAMGLFLISPFLLSLIFAGTIALAIYPLQIFLEQKGLRPNRAAFLLTSAFTTIISIPFSFFLVKGTIAVTHQLQTFATDVKFKGQGFTRIMQILKGQVIDKVHWYSEKFGFDQFLTEDRINSYFITGSDFLLKFFQDFAASIPTLFLYFIVMIICLYSFLKHGGSIRNFTQSVLGFDNGKMDQLVRVFIIDSRGVYISNIVTGSVQSVCVAVAVGLLGLGDFFLVFFVTLILSFVPVVGAAPVAFLFALLAFLQGETTYSFILIGVGLFTGAIDNILRPYLASLGESNIPPVAAFVCVIGGALLFGFPGLFIGLLVGSFTYDTLPIFWNEIGKNKGDHSVPELIYPAPSAEDLAKRDLTL